MTTGSAQLPLGTTVREFSVDGAAWTRVAEDCDKGEQLARLKSAKKWIVRDYPDHIGATGLVD